MILLCIIHDFSVRCLTSMRRTLASKWSDVDQRQYIGQVLGHGVTSDRLVYSERNAVAEGSAPSARSHAAIALRDRDGAGQPGRQFDNDHGHWRRSRKRGTKVVWWQRRSRRGGRRHNDHDRGDHVDHQPHDHVDENDRETKEEDFGIGKHRARRENNQN